MKKKLYQGVGIFLIAAPFLFTAFVGIWKELGTGSILIPVPVWGVLLMMVASLITGVYLLLKA